MRYMLLRAEVTYNEKGEVTEVIWVRVPSWQFHANCSPMHSPVRNTAHVCKRLRTLPAYPPAWCLCASLSGALWQEGSGKEMREKMARQRGESPLRDDLVEVCVCAWEQQ